MAALFRDADTSRGHQNPYIIVYGTASPDGDMTTNECLARRRVEAMRAYIIRNYGVDSSRVEVGGAYIPWGEFRENIAASGISSGHELVAICNIGDDGSSTDTRRRLSMLRLHDGGRSWKVLAEDILPTLRRSVVVSMSGASEAVDVFPQPESEIGDADNAAEAMEPVSEPDVTPGYVMEEECRSQWHLSTNTIEWGLLIANVAGEWDFSYHWSGRLSLHYSALNYFTSTRKFRTFILRPEVRYWLKSGHRGLFFDAHLQMASYNYALKSNEYRIQDVDGKHPALGGGIGLGYRLPFGRSGRWAFEGAVGAGVYHLEYNRFENRVNGPLVDTRRRTMFCIDNVALSIVYNFNGALNR